MPCCLWPPDGLRPIVTREGWEGIWHFEALKDPLRSDLFVLQSNPSGTPLFSDGATVLGFAEETETLEEIAALEVFSRFCLRHSLNGEDWVVAWRRGDGESEGIRPLAHF